MCFTIPKRVEKINNGTATIEGGRQIKLGSDLMAKKGDYLQVVGNLAVGKISREEGLKIRKLIKRLYAGKQ